MRTKYNIGCGKTNFGPNWIHVDAQKFPHVEFHDPFNLPGDPGTADLIYSSHFLEYFDRDVARVLLGNWFVLLKSGGSLRLAVPDFEVMAKLYARGDIILDDILGPLYGKMTINGCNLIHHKTVYDFRSLMMLLFDIGFESVHKWDWHKFKEDYPDDCSRAYLSPKGDFENGTLISLNVEATKP